MIKFKKVIRQRRIKLGISLKKFAQELNLSPGYVCKIERGTYPPPPEKVIQKMAQILQYDADELLAIAGKIPSDLMKIIIKHPSEVGKILREMRKKKCQDGCQDDSSANEESAIQLNLFN